MNPIANCRVEFAFQCPKQWEELSPAENATMRYCHVCKEKVHLVSTMAQVHDHASRGECIAVGLNPYRRKSSKRILMGLPAISSNRDFSRNLELEKRPWWKRLIP